MAVDLNLYAGATCMCHFFHTLSMLYYSIGSNDRSLRVWEETDEQVFLEEEREKRMEDMFDEGAQIGNSKACMPVERNATIRT